MLGATIADRFAVHRRTLSRHPEAEGAGFQSLVNETPVRDRPRELLSQTRIPLSGIAVALGYSEASAFTRPSAAGRGNRRRLGAWNMVRLNPVIQLLDRRTTTGDSSTRHRPADGLDRGTDTKAGVATLLLIRGALLSNPSRFLFRPHDRSAYFAVPSAE